MNCGIAKINPFSFVRSCSNHCRISFLNKTCGGLVKGNLVGDSHHSCNCACQCNHSQDKEEQQKYVFLGGYR